jgi:hypothetical protein
MSNTLLSNIVAPSAIVQLSATQTLTNKTLTSPTINSGTENNLTLTGSLTAGGSTGTAGQFLQTTGTGTTWGYPTTFGSGTSTLQFGTDGSGNPTLVFTLANTVIATMTVNGLTMAQPINMSNNTISALGTPVLSTDAANKGYADGAATSSAYPHGDYGGFSGSTQDAFGVSLTPLIQYDNMTPVGTLLAVDFGALT